MFGTNKNKGYAQQGSITGGYENTYKVNPGAIGGVNIYKTKNGTRGLHGMDGTYYEKEAGSGKFYKSSGRDWVQVEDYNSKPPEEEAKQESSGGGSSGGGSSGSSSGGYGTTNPYAGNTGSPGLDASTEAMLEMVRSLTSSLTASWDMRAAAEDVTRPAGEGLSSTVLTGGSGYLPSERKKKKSYLTPISVG
jgi:hypothetical protein